MSKVNSADIIAMNEAKKARLAALKSSGMAVKAKWHPNNLTGILKDGAMEARDLALAKATSNKAALSAGLVVGVLWLARKPLKSPVQKLVKQLSSKWNQLGAKDDSAET